MDGWMDGGGTYAALLEAMFIDTATFSKLTCLLFVRWLGWMSFVVCLSCSDLGIEGKARNGTDGYMLFGLPENTHLSVGGMLHAEEHELKVFTIGNSVNHDD